MAPNPTIPFGKHAGERCSNVPIPYLDWLIGQDWFKVKFPRLYPDVLAYLNAQADWHGVAPDVGDERYVDDDDDEYVDWRKL